MKEVGAVLGLTESRVCQLHNQALLRLRAKMSKEEQDRAGPERAAPEGRKRTEEAEPTPLPRERSEAVEGMKKGGGLTPCKQK
jgi:hypothetical protein